MAALPVKYENHPKYLGFTLDPEFTSNRHVEEPMSIWILSDSRSAIQHLSNWSSVGDKTVTSILYKLKQVSSSYDVHFQWITSHLYSARKHIDKKTWLIPSVLTWYRADSPGGSLAMNCDRCPQTVVSRFLSGHLRSLVFQGGHKTHTICLKCNIEQASPTPILGCLSLSYGDLLGFPMLVYDFLRVSKLIDLVQQKLYKGISNYNRTALKI
ncbi:RNase H domain-containing protein [Trichonephila clavipes]|nr:RNase H domain-containing protein [Trichonephila clavipes]